jgi:pimeloyl-ACP methyl ester carboxylesterase
MEKSMFLIGCAVPIVLAVSALAALLVHRKLRQASTAKTLRIANQEGIVEERFVPVGGIDQWISIRGEDRNNPILLMLHGGPGSSYCIFTPQLRAWEKHFTIVQWDQRGAGKTFARTGSRGCGEMSMKQLINDAIEVAEYLRGRLKQNQLFLLASSIGSTFGLQVVRSRPELFYAYIGTDQNVGMVRGQELNYRQVVERLRALGMDRGARVMERIGANPACWSPRDFTDVAQWTMKSDPSGFRRTMKLLKDAVWYSPEWTLRDIRAFVKGMHFSLEQLLPELVRFDAWACTRFDLPIFIFQGESDVLTTLLLAQQYFDDIEAPLKKIERISGAGHLAAFLQAEQFLDKLLIHVRPLAHVSDTTVAT